MPGLFGRAMMIVKAKFSRLLDHAENPAETLDYSYEEQLRQLQNVKRGIADVATAKKRLEMQYTSMQQQAGKLDSQAKQALTANREDLAREALTRKAAIEGQLEGIMQSGQQLEAQQQKLVESEKALSMKVESFRTQKEVIKAQYSAAEAQVRIGEAATGISSQMSDVGLAVERAKDKTQSMQARADAISELTEAGALTDFTSSGDDIDRQLKQIQQSGQVDDELAKLKAELGSGEAPTALEAADEAPAEAAPDPALEAEPADAEAVEPEPRKPAEKTT
jgi:phage shock protein A